MNPHRIAEGLVFAVHERQVAEHGGAIGVRDPGAIESAMARPRNLAAYGDPDLADLAAAYAYSIAKNHGFADGNKRTAWVIARTFLAINGCTLTFDDADAVLTVESLAAGTMDEGAFAQWLRERMR